MVSFRSLTTGLGVECGSRAVKDRSSTGCVIRSKKTKMDPRGKITLKKKKKSGPGRTISLVYLLLKEKERENVDKFKKIKCQT